MNRDGEFLKLRMPMTVHSSQALILLSIGLSLIHVDCGSFDQANTPCTPAVSSSPSPALGLPVKHVFIVVEENHDFSSVIGNANMPYLNSLATTYALAKGYHANTHPSIGNYFMLTTGQIITNDDGFSGTVTEDNAARHLIQAGKTWKEYSEGLPSAGYTGGDSGGYVQHHNPFSYFSDVRDSPAQANNLVPFSQFSADLASHTLPDFSFIVPDDSHNGHNGDLAAADNWLKTKIDPLIGGSDFNAPNGGLLIITFDESATGDKSQGGGSVAWVTVGPNVKRGFTSATCFQHQSTLRLMSEAIGLTSFPAAAATAPDMREFISGN